MRFEFCFSWLGGFVGGKFFSSTILESLDRSENETDKGRLTGEKHKFIKYKFHVTQDPS